MTKSKHRSRKIVLLIVLSLTAIVFSSYFYAVEKREQQFASMVKYHSKMVKLGSRSSLVKLGKMYEKGQGVEKDLSKAQELFKKAINYNQYLDEIYPSYSQQDSSGNNSEKNVFTKTEDKVKQKNQLNNIISSVKKSAKTNKRPPISTASKKPKVVKKRNYISYVKIKKQKNTKSLSKTVIKPKKKVLTKKSIPIKKVAQKKRLKKKSNSHQKIKRTKIAKNSKFTKKTSPRQKKIASKKLSFKKTVAFKKQKNTKPKAKSKKVRLQAKRSPRLNEARPDYETNFGIFDEDTPDEPEDNEEDTILSTDDKKVEKVNIGSNFITNPCATESARYIAKCRRINKQK